MIRLTALARRIRLAFTVLAGAASGLAGAHAGQAPRRVVSLNLCADQLLMRLAAPGQIASLSPLARDASISSVAAEAARLPANRGSAEEAVRQRADLVLTGPYDRRNAREILASAGIPVHVVEEWRGLAHGRLEVAALAARLGRPEAGAELIRRLDAALARAPRRTGETVLVVERRGWAAGPASPAGALVEAFGLTNLAVELGYTIGGFLPLERLVAMKPDLIVVLDPEHEGGDQGTALFSHPAFAAAFPPGRRISLPSRLVVCPVASLPEAIEAMSAALSRAAPRP
jgi:iron complex transport system substrate-binding protein